MDREKILKICEKGHKYYKTSSCTSCPTCNRENKTAIGFLSKLSSPARNALIREGIETLEELSKYSENEILKLRGIGPSSVPILKSALETQGLSFNN